MKSSTILLVLLGAALVPAPALLGCEPPEAPPPAAAAPAPTTRPAGLLAFVDPVTGKLFEPPPADVEEMLRSASFRAAVSTSHDGLTEVKRPTGGYGLNLQGRFRSAVVAVVGPDGKVRMGHPAPPPGPPPAAAPKDGGTP